MGCFSRLLLYRCGAVTFGNVVDGVVGVSVVVGSVEGFGCCFSGGTAW